MRGARRYRRKVFQLELAAKVDRGLVRQSQGDVARVIPSLALALVADGEVSVPSGVPASQTVTDALELTFRQLGGLGKDVEETRERLLMSLGDANRQVRLSAEGLTGSGVSLVAAAFAPGHALVASVGNARCYRWRGGTPILLTPGDDSEGIGFSPARGMGAPGARSRWLGVHDDLDVSVSVTPCEPGDVFVLCTDGLWGALPAQAWARTVARAFDARETCDALVSAAWAAGGLDSIGVAVIRLVPLTLQLEPPHLMEADILVSAGPSA